MGAIIGRRFVWELGDGTSHTRDSQHTSSGFVHSDLGNPALWSCERVTLAKEKIEDVWLAAARMVPISMKLRM